MLAQPFQLELRNAPGEPFLQLAHLVKHRTEVQPHCHQPSPGSVPEEANFGLVPHETVNQMTQKGGLTLKKCVGTAIWFFPMT